MKIPGNSAWTHRRGLTASPGLSCRARLEENLQSQIIMKLLCTPLSIRGIQHVTKDFPG